MQNVFNTTIKIYMTIGRDEWGNIVPLKVPAE